MIKSRNGINLLMSILLIGLGAFILMFTSDIVKSNCFLMVLIMSFIAIIKLIQYTFTKQDKDYSDLLIFGVSIAAMVATISFCFPSSPMALSLTLIGWVSAVAVIKLIKVDYYMDRHNNMWYISIVSFLLFLLTGILTSINLYYSAQVQALMLGNFVFIFGILEMLEPITSFILKTTKPEKKVKSTKSK